MLNIAHWGPPFITTPPSRFSKRYINRALGQIASVQKRELDGAVTAMAVGLTALRVALSVVLVVGLKALATRPFWVQATDLAAAATCAAKRGFPCDQLLYIQLVIHVASK